jgi:NAD(P)-dependent dehydrogenase (short-subunit alcohol dehydrogenase family)
MTQVLIIGASRGIGLEFVKQYAEAGAKVHATARDAPGAQLIAGLGAQAYSVDVTHENGMDRFATALTEALAGRGLDIAIYVAGVYSESNAMVSPDRKEFDYVMHANVLGVMRAIPAIAPLVEAGNAAKGGRFVFISSGMGCITEVESSYGWTYRVSKAALNMAVQSARFDYPKAYFTCMCPGWVRTDMGGPDASLSVEESVSAMRKTIASIKRGDANAFWHHDGTKYSGW